MRVYMMHVCFHMNPEQNQTQIWKKDLVVNFPLEMMKKVHNIKQEVHRALPNRSKPILAIIEPFLSFSFLRVEGKTV